jgi:hypothetical protein
MTTAIRWRPRGGSAEIYVRRTTLPERCFSGKTSISVRFSHRCAMCLPGGDGLNPDRKNGGGRLFAGKVIIVISALPLPKGAQFLTNSR